MTLQVEMNPVYIPALDSDTRVQIFFGGSASGKSTFVAQRAVLDVLQGQRNYLVLRNVAKTLRASVYNQIVKTIKGMGLAGSFRISKGDMTITCRRNGRQFLFAGLDDVDKLKSITPETGVMTDVWIEEATEVSKDAYKQLTKRLRGRDGNAKKRVTISFNPITKGHWLYKEFFGGWDETRTLYSGDNLSILKTTYKDNMFLTADDIQGLETEPDRYYYDVYTLGNWGVLGKVVYSNWKVADLSKFTPRFDSLYNGLDFGFAEDPNALVRLHVDQARKRIFVYSEFYKAGLYDEELAQELKSRIGDQIVTCDSSAAQTIAKLQQYGVNAIPAVKGPDSINAGISFLRGYEVIVDIRCQKFRNEIEVYHYEEDKHGNTLARPVKKNDHLMDAIRYAVEPLRLQTEGKAARRLTV